MFWLFLLRHCLNYGVKLFQLASSFYNDSFSSWIRSLFDSKCSVRWLIYSSFFCFKMSSILSKIGLYFCFNVSWYTLSYWVLSIKDSCFFWILSTRFWTRIWSFWCFSATSCPIGLSPKPNLSASSFLMNSSWAWICASFYWITGAGYSLAGSYAFPSSLVLNYY